MTKEFYCVGTVAHTGSNPLSDPDGMDPSYDRQERGFVDNLLVTTGFMAARKCARKEKSKRDREIIAGKDSDH